MPAWVFGMRSPTNFLATAAFLAILGVRLFGADHVAPAAESAWRSILEAVNITPGDRLEIRIGTSPGVTAAPDRVLVRRILDARRPALEIYWDPPRAIPHYRLPAGAQVFAWERWTQAPVMAGWREEDRAILWLATDPGPKGFERFPYLLQALADLGIAAPARAHDLWAFFDSSYRLRTDKQELARRWQRAGISAIHVAAWHYWEPDAGRDAWLEELIRHCHEAAIHVYAWIELPHVSEAFWRDHPAWREKTALGADAHLDWRKLMNLQNADCAREVERGTRALAARFDWDGINLGELYFESLEGVANPARFTPFNLDARKRFERERGFDPQVLFGRTPPKPEAVRQFLDFRAALTVEMQAHWLGVLASLREQRPHLDLVLTHIDDRFDDQMRDLLGADAAAALPLLDRFDFTFLIEDPATVWHLGPQRYPEIARRYAPLTPHRERLAIDLNIVERYQDVYPTKVQTGVELFQLVHLASASFARVALYFENSIQGPDLDLLAASAAVLKQIERTDSGVRVELLRQAEVRFPGPVRLDGQPWPVTDGEWVTVPAGVHWIETDADAKSGPAIERLNAQVIRAVWRDGGVELEYESRARALIRWRGRTLVRPAGRHTVYLAADATS